MIRGSQQFSKVKCAKKKKKKFVKVWHSFPNANIELALGCAPGCPSSSNTSLAGI